MGSRLRHRPLTRRRVIHAAHKAQAGERRTDACARTRVVVQAESRTLDEPRPSALRLGTSAPADQDQQRRAEVKPSRLRIGVGRQTFNRQNRVKRLFAQHLHVLPGIARE